jgi:hypothetical protein
MKKSLDFLVDSVILFPVMRDMITCEEVFEASAQEREELNVWCDEMDNEAIFAQDAEMDLKEQEKA